MAGSAKTPAGRRTAKPDNSKPRAPVVRAKPASSKVKPAPVSAMKAVVAKVPVKTPLPANGPASRAIEKKVSKPPSAQQGTNQAAPAKVKVKKAKLIRDSFTMPEAEYEVLAQVKRACIQAGFEIKKSELLRAGVALIRELEPARLAEILSSLPKLKSGRPKKL